MKRNQLSYIIVGLVLLFGYQNCQQSGFQPDTLTNQGSENQAISAEPQILPLSSESLKELDFKTEQVSNVEHAGKIISVVGTVLYKVDLYDGKMILINQDTNQSAQYCLSSALKSELDQILSESSICQYDGSHVSSQQVCGQAIQEHYAELSTNRETFKLGYATDTCGTNKVDLCSDRSIVLKQFFNKVKAQLSLLGCQ